MSERYPCPCCGHLVFGEPPDSYDICAVCFWEDDAVQLRWPDLAGGANGPSLIDAQKNYARSGAIEDRFLGRVRASLAAEPLEAGWRSVDPSRDSFEARDDYEQPWPDDLTVRYWWRPSFWRRG